VGEAMRTGEPLVRRHETLVGANDARDRRGLGGGMCKGARHGNCEC